ncbi:MAG TPA: hypothetical protein VGS22_15850 [Thermoanaerobaculia bacterium]|nr:hypothetical protein [Thermoanaerobaculia bacterium]
MKLDLSRTASQPEILAAGFDESFLGAFISQAKIELPEGFPALAPADLVMKNCAIGSGGFTGKLQAEYYDETTHTFLRPDSELFGIPFRLKHVILEIRQNTFARSEILGQTLLPFFDDWVEVEIGLDGSGKFHVRLADADGSGLKEVNTPAFSMQLDSIAFEVEAGVFTAKVAGQLTPKFGGLAWPRFDVKELSIDSKGHVHLDGGWLKLPEQKTFNFYGFKIEITQLGFGKNDDGSKWVGFSGGLHLVDGLQAGASVEGLRITWNPADTPPVPRITLNGAGVELKIPDVLELKGSVSFKEINDPDTGEEIKRFDGDIHLTLETPELEIDGTLVIGSVKGPQGRYNFFAIYVDVELPNGIPLASTGLGIYGFAGLFALQMEPNKKPEDMWFSIDHGKSFYHKPTQGITDLKSKWVPRKESFAIGAGITLGTLADNAYTFSGKFLLAIIIPGPIVMIQGAASFLKKRAEGADEGQFRALTVIDGRAGNILIGLDAEYKSGKGGELIEIGGSMEAYYAFNDPTAWHLYLGLKEPRELRIRALFARLVEANAYFMLDAHQLGLGAWFGYANSWRFGPLSVTLEAWADGNALLSFKPGHFHGDLWLHALVGLKVFGFGLEIGLDATIAADLFKPYHLVGTFSVGIKLPWPFKKKIGATVKLEWGPKKDAPPIPLPLTQAAIEHLKSTVVWPLPRRQFLLPDWDDGSGFVVTNIPAYVQPADLNGVPLVPLDARISLTFGRSVHDAAFVGVNTHQPNPAWELIPPNGAVVRARYELTSLVLQRWNDPAWTTVAQSPVAGSTPTLFGTWATVPALPGPAGSNPPLGNTKLLVGSKTPFDFTRGTGSSWEEWVSDALPNYPCIPELPATETCVGFAGLRPGTRIDSPLRIAGPPALTLSWGFGPAFVDTRLVTEAGAAGIVNVLCFPETAMRRGLTLVADQPAKSYRILLARGVAPGPGSARKTADVESFISTIDEVPVCVDLRTRRAGTVANPWSEGKARFTVRGADGALLPVGRIERWGEGELGLSAGFKLDVELPCPSSWVELLVTHRPPFRIVAYNGAGAAVATHAPQGTGGEVTETIRLEGTAIRRLEVYAAGNEKLIHRVCWFCPTPTGTWATGYDTDHLPYGPFLPVIDPAGGGAVITVVGPGIPTVILINDGPLCLEQLCMTPDPEAGQGVRRDEAIRHLQQELARWKSEGEVLAPHTIYRLQIDTKLETVAQNDNVEGLVPSRNVTEYAYFRTGGPPGLVTLTVPEGTSTANFDSGLEDLTRYVCETDPPTVPPPGEKPRLFQPFYRAYDVGVQFNENYVAQMYQMEKRDLGLYLFDASNQPARDARGRLLALTPAWSRATTLSLSEKEQRWITLLDAATCLTTKLDPETIVKNAVLVSAEEGRVLAPVTLYEGRLMPLLLHEAFTVGAPGAFPPGWFVADSSTGAPSDWQVMEQGDPLTRHVVQGSAIGGAAEPDRPGTILLLADPASAGWTDFRVSVFVRKERGAAGVVFRHGGAGSWVRFALHERTRRLVKAGSGGITLLAEDHVSARRNRDYLLTVEAIGTSLRTYVDGEPVFTVEDGDHLTGRIGLYTCQSPGARFTDLRVDDFRAGAPVVYRFQLATSLYANFYHHLHGFEDMTWPSVDLGTDAGAALALAVAPSYDPPKEAETRAFEDVAKLALGEAPALQRSTRVEVTRLTRSGGGPVLLLRSPEPIDWTRTEIALSRPAHPLPEPSRPGDAKLTEVTFGALRPAEESVTLLLREAGSLTRHRIELRELPGPIAESADDPVLFLESFRSPGALARFELFDQATDGRPSNWLVEGGALLQLAEIGGGAEPALPGTQALIGPGADGGDPPWADYRLTADLRSDAGGSLGLVFRWVDAENHYRLSADATLHFRRLIKREGGQVTILWEDAGGYSPGEPFRLEIEAAGPRLTGWLDGVRLFAVVDAAHTAGRVGVYAWRDGTVRCERLEVRRPSAEGQALLRDAFAAGDLSDWSLLSEVSGVPLNQSAAWQTADGALHLQSLLAQGGDPAFPGALAAAGDPAWKDVLIRVRLRSKGEAIGIVFRGQNLANYYRFAMSRTRGTRQLIKKVGGVPQVLWQDDELYEIDRPYELIVAAVGTSLRGWLDGAPLFAVEDAAHPSGRIALYAWNNLEAWFSEVRVGSADRVFSAWWLDEGFAAAIPGRWSFLAQGGGPDPVPWTIGAGSLHSEPEPAVWEEPAGGVDNVVRALAWVGGKLYAAGSLTHAGGVAAHRIAVWSGGAWQALGTGLDGIVRALAVDGDRLYVGGKFTQAGGSPVDNVAVWDRAAGTWSALGDGINGQVFALAVEGDLLYAGGQFTTAGGVAAKNLAVWNPTTGAWSAVGGGLDAPVLALAARDGRLFVGGKFNHAGGKPASRVARWDGTNWTAAGGTINGTVSAIAVGPGAGALFVGGDFTQAGGVAANHIARWTGNAWVALGVGVDGPVDALALDGKQLWVGSRFIQAGGAPAGRITRWSLAARAWSSPGDGLDNSVFALAPAGDRLWAGGAFTASLSASPLHRITALRLGGARFALAANPAPANFRLAVRLAPGADGAAAVIVRFRDASHYLALWLDAERGQRRLVRVDGGPAQNLWQDAVRPVAGQEYAVTIDAVGERLTGYVNGVRLFDVQVSGQATVPLQIGVAVRRSPDARFREVRLAEPAWSVWHAFGEEEDLLAGTRIRVHGVLPSPAALREPGLTLRSVARTGESGRLRLSSSRGAELRLVAPDGTPGHARTFLGPETYTPVTATVLRKADGTGLVLLPEGDAGADSLRLTLTYHRCREEAGRAFSQEGDKGPERVTLDIP